jgi:hypothetical protein
MATPEEIYEQIAALPGFVKNEHNEVLSKVLFPNTEDSPELCYSYSPTAYTKLGFSIWYADSPWGEDERFTAILKEMCGAGHPIEADWAGGGESYAAIDFEDYAAIPAKDFAKMAQELEAAVKAYWAEKMFKRTQIYEALCAGAGMRLNAEGGFPEKWLVPCEVQLWVSCFASQVFCFHVNYTLLPGMDIKAETKIKRAVSSILRGACLKMGDPEKVSVEKCSARLAVRDFAAKSPEWFAHAAQEIADKTADFFEGFYARHRGAA